MIDAGLIKRHKGKYSLTLLGKAVYDSQMTIGYALQYYWKLKTIESIESIESIEMYPSVALTKDDLSKLVDTPIDNQQIKVIVMLSILKSWPAK